MKNLFLPIVFKNFCLFVSTVALIVSSASCSKTEQIEEGKSNDTPPIDSSSSSNKGPAQVLYYLDNVSVTAYDINFNDSTLEIIVNNEGNDVMGIYAYTTLKGYIKKGTALGHNFTKLLQIENDLRNYADSIGAITLYDQTGTIDSQYTAYEQNYIANTPELQPPALSNSVPTGYLTGVWYDDIWTGTQPNIFYPSVSAWMWFGLWQRKVSCYVPLYIYGVDRIYSNTWFRKRMATLTNWGWQAISFGFYPLNFMNNKSRSWLAAGL